MERIRSITDLQADTRPAWHAGGSVSCFADDGFAGCLDLDAERVDAAGGI